MTAEEIFETKAHYNKWLKELTVSEKELIVEMLKEALSYTAPTRGTIGKKKRA
jgi:hypothetical protein